ncbi:hypothetical protein [Pseudolactococcus reticulitermitis]|uniref:Uncharacterized protein n=1 Tax=Pseudolactococcus reticulitermitis TaxID=2025039 RepID=A0A224X7U1_9LACT|nr:hypothetical protein [Lactococcus reticulitermitis]GAX48486.1 hypothetical protein RsY01_2115 [Lactococcus reticulitermitis]
MSILSELDTLLDDLSIPVAIGVFSDVPPNEYCVLTPLADVFEVFCDNAPLFDTHEVRLSLFSRGNYLLTKEKITTALLEAEFTIINRLFVDYENNTGYYHIAIDVAKYYEMAE